MTRVRCAFPLFLTLTLWVMIRPAPATAAPPPSRPGEVILKFKATASQADKDLILGQLHAARIKHFARINADHERITGMSAEEAVSRFRGNPAVQYIEPNYIAQAVAVPNDPSFDLLWGMRNTGQFGGAIGADIDAVDAWDLATGSSDVVVGMIDTGIDYTHPDLAANIYVNTGEIAGNGIDDDGNGFIDDVRGWDFVNNDNNPMDDNLHGTHTAGTVGAVGDNGIGVVGVCWHVRLMPLKFLSSFGSGSYADAISAIEYGIRMHVKILSNSWGGFGYSDALRSAIADADAAGILFVAAAGNADVDTDVTPFYPAAYDLPNIISVAATTPSDDKAFFSNFGATTVDLGAPGTQTLSTVPSGGYAYLQGTSMACPHVAGALALLYSRFPLLTPQAAKTHLMNSTDRIPGLNGLCVSGGRLNLFRALQGPDSIPPAPVSNLAATGIASNRIALDWTATGDDGNVGTAAAYDIRYSLAPITGATFDAATPVPVNPSPEPSGAHQQFIVGGLNASTTYFLAMKVRDEYGNTSTLSNVAYATTFVAPDIDVSPTSFSASLVSGSTDASRTITLRNLTAGTLDYEIVPVATGSPATGPVAAPAASSVNFRWSDFVQAAAADSVLIASTAVTAADLPPVLVDPAGDGGPVDVTQLLASAGHDSIAMELDFSTTLDRLNFGGFLSLDTDQNPATGVAPSFGNGSQTVGAEYEIQLFQLGSGIVSVYEAGTRRFIASVPAEVAPHYVRFRVPLSALGGDDGSMNVSGVIGDDVGPTDWFPDSGHGTIAGIRWFSALPSAGTVGPGGTLTLRVTFDANGLQAGAYDGELRILSNDPDEPVTTIVGHLDVSGTPAISFSSTVLAFGSVPFGGSRTDSIVVRNVGTGTLHVTDLFTDDPVFALGTTPFTLNPGQARSVLVTFTPNALTTVEASLYVLSDDPVDGEIFIMLSGSGALAPDIAISPGSFAVSMPSSQTAARTMTVSNTGTGSLTVGIAARGAVTALAGTSEPPPTYGGAANSIQTTDGAPVAAEVGSVAPASVLVIQDTPAWGLTLSSFLQQRFGITPTVVSSFSIGALDFSAYDLIVTDGDENSAYYGNISIQQPKFEAFVNAGGVVQYQLATQGSEVRLVGNARARFGFLELQNQPVLPLHPIVTGSPWILEGNYANHNYFTNLPPNARIITETTVSRVPTTVEYEYGQGKVIATGMTWEFLYLLGFPAAPLLTHATEYSLSQVRPRWLHASPTTATVPPGGSQSVTLIFDSHSIPTGGYDASIRLTSNDPDEGTLNVPAHLDVLPAPNITLSRPSVDFGSVFRGGSRQDTLSVWNTGTDPLTVSQVVSTHPDFTSDLSSFTVNPGQRRVLTLTFRPSATGPVQGALQIRSNDLDEPDVSVPLSGVGTDPPVLVLNPDSFSASLLGGETAAQTLHLGNQGSAALEFQLRAVYGVGGASASTTTAAAPMPAAPTLNESAPASAPPEVAGMYSGDRMTFGISDFGEIMPFQMPTGNEHLQVGTYLSGYMVAYMDGGIDRIRWCANYDRFGFVPVSYQEIENSSSRVVVEVVTRTSDGHLEVRRRFVFLRHDRSIVVQTRVVNISGAPLGDVVFKEFADWDVDGTWDDDSWGYDMSRNMIYASGTRYVAIASLDAPTLMDIYGWDDYRTRQTFVQYPSGNVSPLDGLEILHYARGTLDPSMQTAITCVYGAGDDLADLQHVIDRAATPPWLSLNPDAGVVPPSSSADVTVGFDARDLIGGDYRATIEGQSNDPARSEISLPVSLRVTGIPAIQVDPLALAFGTVFVGVPAQRPVVVKNPGSDLLTVSATVSDPVFTANPGTFQVAAHDSQVVQVTFTPSVEGDVSASLTFAHNAPVPAVTVALQGHGVMPPDIDVFPTALTSSLMSGASETQPLHVRNTGASDLVVNVGTGNVFAGGAGNPSPTTPSGSSRTAGTSHVTEATASTPSDVLVIQDTDAWGLQLASFLTATFGIVPTVIHSTDIAATDFSPYRLILTDGDESSSYYDALSANRAKFEAFVSSGGVVQYQLATQGANVQVAGGAVVNFGHLEEVNRVLLPTHPIVTGLPELLVGNFASHTYVTSLPAGARVITETYVSHLPTTVEYPIGLGTVLVTGMTWEYLYLYGYPAGAMLPQATAYSLGLASPAWLRVSPGQLTVPPGGTLDIGVTFRAAGLLGGEYHSAVRITSNDPDESHVVVPVTLRVTGVPDIAVSAGSVDFGTVFLGLARQDSIVVSNTGTDQLDVTGIVASPAAFTQDAAPFALAPGARRVVHVTFQPGSAGPFAGSLELHSNDPDEAVVSVALTGLCVPAPVIAFSPTSIHADVPKNTSQSQTLTVRNTGGSDLTFDVSTRITASDIAVRPSLDLAKGQADPRIGSPVAQGSGGPDQFGYVWTDSDDPQGPPFGWIDISTTGTVVPISGDDMTSDPIPLAFPFPFYGKTFTTFRVCTNGFLSFTYPFAPFTNQPLPNQDAPENMIAPFWDDLFVNPGFSTILTHSDALRTVIEFKNVYLLAGPGPYTFEIVLFPNGFFLMQYLTVLGPTGSETVGFQNEAKDDGQTIAFNTPYLHEGLAIRCSAIPQWLSVSPVHGTVPPGGSLGLQVVTNATNMEPGSYGAMILAQSNDPVAPNTSVPVSMHVLGLVGAAATQVDPNTLNRLSNGQYIQAYVELPAGLDPNGVVLSSVRFQNAIAPSQAALILGDFNVNGVPDLQFKFDRTAVEQLLAEGDIVPVVVTGDVASTASFVARDTIRVIRPRLHSPNGGERLEPGTIADVSWQSPEGWKVSTYELYYTLDDGVSWTLVDRTTDAAYPWPVPPRPTTTARLRVYAYDAKGVMGYDSSDQIFTITGNVAAVADGDALPLVNALFQNKPNPFNPSTTIRYDLPTASRVRIAIYGVDGRRVRTLLDRMMPAGRHAVTWDGTDDGGREVGTSVYFYRMSAGSFEANRKLLLLK